LLKAVKTSGATLVYEYKNLNGIAIRPASKTNIEDAIAYFKKVNGVLSVEQDRLLKLQ
jgi:putative lipoprotein